MSNRVRLIVFMADGQLTASRNVLRGSVMDTSVGDGWTNEFNLKTQKSDPGGPPIFWACSWPVWRTGLGRPSAEAFEAIVISGLGMEQDHNTGENSTKIGTYLYGDEPGDDFDSNLLTPFEALELAMVGGHTPDLERVPEV